MNCLVVRSEDEISLRLPAMQALAQNLEMNGISIDEYSRWLSSRKIRTIQSAISEVTLTKLLQDVADGAKL